MPSNGDTAKFNARTQATVLMSRQLRNVERFTKTRDLVKLTTAITKLGKCMEALEESHHEYMITIDTSKTSAEDLKKDEEVIDDFQIKFNDIVDNANSVLDIGVKSVQLTPDVTAKSAEGDINITEIGKSITRAMSIPQKEVSVYTGDALGFYRFFSLFENNIGKKLDDELDKVLKLISYLEGDALEEVDHVCLNPNNYTYEQVKDKLKMRFAQKEMIGEALQIAAVSGGKVKTAEDFAKFSAEMTKLNTSMTDLQYDGQINTLRFINSIMLRTSVREREKWKEHAYRLKESAGGVSPGFLEFVEFIRKKSARYNDPVLGSEADKRALDVLSIQARVNNLQTGPQKKPQRQDAGSSEGASAYQKGCRVCNDESHQHSGCPKMEAMTLKERVENVKKHRMCIRCLKSGHIGANCRSSSGKCGVEDCPKMHHKWLHSKEPLFKAAAYNIMCTGIEQVIHVDTHQLSTPTSVANILLPIVKVLIRGHIVYGLLDHGSTNSLISKSLVTKLGMNGVPVKVQLSVVGHLTNSITKLVSFDVKGFDENVTYKMRSVISVPEIPACNEAAQADLRRYRHLDGVPTYGAESHQVELLIGQDHSYLLVPDEVRQGGRDEPHATHTPLGWAIQGPINNVGIPKKVKVNFLRSVPPPEVITDISKLWSQEKDDETVLAWSPKDKQVYEYWERTCTTNDEGRYVIPIPFKEGAKFPNNRPHAMARLMQNVRRMKQNGTYDSYDVEMRKVISDKYAELVPPEALLRNDGFEWWLPHFGVYREDKPGKTRVVMDAKSEYEGVSLNTQAYPGPDLNNKLVDILTRFRQYEAAVTGDIQAMYHRVVIPEAERDVLRFLWFDEQGTVRDYRWTCHIFGGIWCASSATFALRRAVDESNPTEQVKRAIHRDTYVDDNINSLRGAENAAKLAKAVSDALKPRGFTMTKFIGHPQNVTELVPENLRAKDVKTIETDPEYSALGLKWDTRNDTIFYRRKGKPLEGVLTKRKMLSQVASVFDPMGLIGPILISGRMLFQRATRLKVGWDAILPDELTQAWFKWWSSLGDLEEITFPRCLLGELYDVTSGDLHHFCDASQQAWGSAAYLRIQDVHGKVHVCLIRAKGRLAPVKQVTIPRLELCAAVTAVKLDVELRREMTLQINTSTFWSDSEIVLKYIRNESLRLKLYVANRISYISSHTSIGQWRHVPTDENPGDVVSRGCAVHDLPEQWKTGPAFLRRDPSEWPVQRELKVKEEDMEIKESVVCLNSVAKIEDDPLVRLLEYYKHDYYKMKVSMAWFNRLVARKKADKTETGSGKGGELTPLTVAEIQKAEQTLVRGVQYRAYNAELINLKQGKAVNVSSPLIKLAPVLRDGMIVVGGRIGLADLPEDAKHPVILPNKNLLSVAILLHVHNKAHLGSEWVLTQVREKYHIQGARTMLRKIRIECIRCNRYFSEPQHQMMADLPKERLQPGPYAFSHAGVDLFGHFLVKIGRASHKRYAVLFTCMASRAVHIEVAHSLDAESFIMAFKRFAARRGTPKTCKSDRGTNIVGATEEMRRAWLDVDAEKIGGQLKRMNCQWVFNTPKNSEAGGVWERMIRTVRKILMGILNPNTTLTDEILSTVLTEAENLINSRPLTRVSDDPTHGVLTPNHILIAQGNSPADLQGHDVGKMVRGKWKQISAHLDNFWTRWKAEYLHTLQQRQKWNKDLTNFKTGDVVVISDVNTPRGSWPLAIVTDTMPGSDGRVRSVTVKTAASQYERPVGKLVKLELEAQEWL